MLNDFPPFNRTRNKWEEIPLPAVAGVEGVGIVVAKAKNVGKLHGEQVVSLVDASVTKTLFFVWYALKCETSPPYLRVSLTIKCAHLMGNFHLGALIATVTEITCRRFFAELKPPSKR